MMPKIFCTPDEYAARYGAAADPAALAECLEEASREITRAVEDAGMAAKLEDPDFLIDCRNVCRDMAHRVLGSSMPVGATSYSQSAAGFSESYSFATPYTSIRLNKADRERLGIKRKGAAASVRVAVHGRDGAPVEGW